MKSKSIHVKHSAPEREDPSVRDVTPKSICRLDT
jgi:hypothetical protein